MNIKDLPQGSFTPVQPSRETGVLNINNLPKGSYTSVSQNQVPPQIEKSVGFFPQVGNFLKKEFSNEGGDISQLPYGTRTLGSIFKSTLGSDGALGLGKQAGKIFTSPFIASDIKRTEQQENYRGELAKQAQDFISQASTEQDPTTKKSLLMKAHNLISQSEILGTANERARNEAEANLLSPRKTIETGLNTALAGLTSGATGLTALGEGLGSGALTKTVASKLLGKFLPEATNIGEKVLTTGRGVLPRALEQGALTTGFNTASNIGEEKPITEGDLSSFVFGSMFPIAGLGASTAKTGLGKIAEKSGLALENTFLKATPKMFRYGKNPGRGILEEVGHFNSFEDGIQKTEEALQRNVELAKQKIQEARNKNPIQTDSISLRDIFNPIDEKLVELKKAPNSNKTAIERLEGSKTDLTNNIDKVDYVSPEKAIELKRLIGDITKFTGNVSDDKAINSVLKRTYGLLMDKIEKAVPGLGDVNGKIADLITAKTALENRGLANEAGAIQRFTTKAARMGALIFGTATLNPAVIVSALGEYGAEKAFDSPAIRSRIASWLYNASTKDRAEVASKVPALGGIINKIFGTFKKKPTIETIDKELELLALPEPIYIEGQPYKGGETKLFTQEQAQQRLSELQNQSNQPISIQNPVAKNTSIPIPKASSIKPSIPQNKRIGKLGTEKPAEDTLIQEASKYKSAEEFVKAQTTQGWSKLQKENPDLFNAGILRKSQAPYKAVGEIPEDVHTMQGKWQNYGQDAEISADKVYNRIDKYGDYVDENGLPIRNQKTGDNLQSNKEWDNHAGKVERTNISNQQLKDEFIKSFSTPEGKKYLNEVVKALPKNPDGSITAYRIGNIGGEGAQSYTLSEGMAKTFSNQGTDILPAGTPGLPTKGYKDFGVLPVNTVKINPKGIVAWSPYDAEILVEPKYVQTKSQLTDIWNKANKIDAIPEELRRFYRGVIKMPKNGQ